MAANDTIKTQLENTYTLMLYRETKDAIWSSTRNEIRDHSVQRVIRTRENARSRPVPEVVEDELSRRIHANHALQQVSLYKKLRQKII